MAQVRLIAAASVALFVLNACGWLLHPRTSPTLQRRTASALNLGVNARLGLRFFFRLSMDHSGRIVAPVGVSTEAGEDHVVDESGEDYLYPSKRFAEMELPRKLEHALASP
jgi:hypothetical protein